jgi:hypothetical protein
MAAKKAKAPKASRKLNKAAAAKKQKQLVAKEPAAKKNTARKVAKKSAPKKPAVKKAAKRTITRTPTTSAAKPSISADRLPWIDVLSQTPLIDDHARQLESFMTAMADGQIDESEIKSQEQRVVALLQEIDPQLDDALYAKVTQLLCELTAYDMMQMLYAMEQARPRTVFQG